MMKNQQNKDCEAKLELLRQEIDNIDEEILNMLEKRMRVVEKVGVLKKNHQEKFFIRSSREADMIKNLVKKSILMPKSAIISIWRKIITASNMSEQELKIAICQTNNIDICRGLIREYYSENVPVITFASALEALLALKEGEANIAIFSISNQEILLSDEYYNEEGWIDLAKNIESEKMDDLKIFAKIPFYNLKNDEENSQNELNFYAIAAKNAEKSSEDNSLLYIESKKTLLGDEILQVLKKNNLKAKFIKSEDIGSKNAHLFEIEGFYTENSLEIQNIKNFFQGFMVKILGNYALPIVDDIC